MIAPSAGGALGRDQADVAHQSLGAREALEIADLGAQPSGGQRVDSAQATQARASGASRPGATCACWTTRAGRFGTKFRPGAFTAITGIEAFSITNGCILAPVILAGAPDPTVLGSADDPLAAARSEVEARLRPLADVDDPALELAGAVVQSMHDMPPDACVEESAARHHIAPRTLQRLFRRYVGASP
jgi:hypothetical protein